MFDVCLCWGVVQGSLRGKDDNGSANDVAYAYGSLQ